MCCIGVAPICVSHVNTNSLSVIVDVQSSFCLTKVIANGNGCFGNENGIMMRTGKKVNRIILQFLFFCSETNKVWLTVISGETK